MDDNVSSMGKHASNGKMMSPLDTLEDAIGCLGKRGAFKNGKKLIVLCVDDTEDNFSVSWMQSGMTMSQCVSLCEVAKTQFLREMNY